MTHRRGRSPVREILGLFALPLLVAETSFFSDEHATLWVVVNVLAYPLIILASLALRELGRAIAVRAIGVRVLGVQFGRARLAAMWRWGSTRVQLSTSPFQTAIFFGADHVRGLRWRLWLGVLAAPLVTLAILLAVLAAGDLAVSDVIWPRGAMVTRPAVAPLIGFASFWLLVWNLLPNRRRAPSPPSDGLLLLRIPRMTDRELAGLLAAPPVDAQIAEAADPDAELRAIEAQLERAPIERTASAWESRGMVGYLHIHREQLDEARAVFLELLEQPPPTPEHAWLVRNNLAWTDFRLRRPELQAEADQHSAAVLEHLPGVPFAMGTRGAVLRWMGQHREAIELCERAFPYARPKDRALIACSLAASWAALGWRAEARHWLALARAHHAGCPLLAEATAALAA